MRKYLLLLLGIAGIGIASAKETMNLYIGTNYIADATVARYQKECSCTLNQSYFNDNGEMLAKMAAGATGYDVIVPTSYAVEELAKMGKIEPLNLKKLPNLKYINSKFLNPAYDPGNKYSVPYAYTPVFIAYNIDKMKQLGITPNTWAVIFDPKYLAKLKGHITVFNSDRNVFAAALLYLGKDPNTTNKADLAAAKNLIEKSSPAWVKFDSDSYYRGLLRGDIWLSMSYSIDIFKTLQDAKASHSPIHIGAMLQKEGDMYELDNLVIPVASAHKDLAYKFINLALDPQSAKELSIATGSSIPNTVALKSLPKNITSIDWIYPHDMSKQYVFKAYDPETRRLVSGYWTQILQR